MQVLVEHLAQLQQLHVTLADPFVLGANGVIDPRHVVALSAKNTVGFQWDRASPPIQLFRLGAHLPFSIRPRGITARRCPKTMAVVLHIPTTSTTTTTTTTPTTTEPTRALEPTPVRKPMRATDFPSSQSHARVTLRCHQCQCQITNTGAYQQCVDLPSEFWQDLLDCWICHPEDEHLQKYGEWTAQRLLRPGRWMSADASLLVHSQDFSGGCLGEVEGPNGSGDTMLPCPECMQELGSVQWLSEESMESRKPLSVRLYKHRISVLIEFEGKPSLGGIVRLEAPYKDCLLYQLYESNHAHAHSKFIFREKNSKQPLALLWVFQWDTYWASGKVPLDAATEQLPSLQRAMKVCYLLPKHDGFSSMLCSWENDSAVETHWIPSRALVGPLLEELEESTRQLPTFAQTFVLGFSLGFLHKHSDK